MLTTEEEGHAFQRLRQLDRDGVLGSAEPGIIPASWLWKVPLLLLVFVALIILI
ncbi:hypothetical protein [Nocardia amamiensis]|uniref:hypothetical protein n=1 Tax=Nocardia amamiensis TaxID=404578 RepID=UPI0012F4D6D7|nr:hypothetical protein [Nocardia amamiensis]